MELHEARYTDLNWSFWMMLALHIATYLRSVLSSWAVFVTHACDTHTCVYMILFRAIYCCVEKCIAQRCFSNTGGEHWWCEPSFGLLEWCMLILEWIGIIMLCNIDSDVFCGSDASGSSGANTRSISSCSADCVVAISPIKSSTYELHHLMCKLNREPARDTRHMTHKMSASSAVSPVSRWLRFSRQRNTVLSLRPCTSVDDSSNDSACELLVLHWICTRKLTRWCLNYWEFVIFAKCDISTLCKRIMAQILA